MENAVLFKQNKNRSWIDCHGYVSPGVAAESSNN